jgi:RNA polymerase sigma-70 factor (ECF subfamily)
MEPMGAAADHRFDELYEQHFRDVLGYCLRRSPMADGYDAANEVFAIAWRRIDDVPRGEAARPWLFVVARRVVHRRWRSTHRFRRLVARAVSARSGSLPDPEAIVVQRAEYDQVLEAASRLGVRDREVLNLAAWEGLPHREIAEVLGCSIATVDQRLHRAKQRLARQYHALNWAGTLPRAAGGEGS